MAIVEGSLVDAAFAKINLTLRVIGRRQGGDKAGYHEIEGLVAFADLADTLTFQPGVTIGLDVSGPFAGASGPPANNLVLKSAAALGRRVDGLKVGHFQLEKNIPAAAGLGGGSADAAAALRLLSRANGLSIDDARLMVAALETGADVPVCLASRACMMRGLGERLSPPFELPRLPAVLVNPGAALATRDVFARFGDRFDNRDDSADVPREPDALMDWLAHRGNDLTPAAIACLPVIAEVLAALRLAPGARLARMSGSGATCFALFTTAGEAAAAAWMLEARHAGWWVCLTTIG
jgi:4-diphosphocytidyl-2-C-methyl-D-erythritol kinase